MQAGKMDRRIQIQADMAGDSDLGEARPPLWETIPGGYVWARRIPLQAGRNSERFSGSERIAEAEIAWEIRYSSDVAGVDAQHSILAADETRWEILHVVEEKRRGELRILAKARVD